MNTNGATEKNDTTTPPVPDRHPADAIYDVRGMLHEATRDCSLALMALVNKDKGYDPAQRVTEALAGLTTADAELQKVEIDFGKERHARSPFASPGHILRVADTYADELSHDLDELDVALLEAQGELPGGPAGSGKGVWEAIDRASVVVRCMRSIVAGIRSDARSVSSRSEVATKQ